MNRTPLARRTQIINCCRAASVWLSRAISTSLVERQNLTMRMSTRRFARLTNAFSKKIENLRAAVALHFAHYNFVRLHRSLNVTPAMQAGVSKHLWSLGELVERTSA
jgi:hypothetical protein